MRQNEHDDDPTHALDDFITRIRPSVASPASAPDLSDLSAKLNRQQPDPQPKPRGGVLRNGATWHAENVLDVPVVLLPRVAPERTDPLQVTLPPVNLATDDAYATTRPMLDLPAVQHPPPSDQGALDDITRQASEFGSSQWDAHALANREPGWQSDPFALRYRRPDHPRIAQAWRPEAWVGAVREVFPSITEFVTLPDGRRILESFPPHLLVLLWQPQRQMAPLLSRWPNQVLLTAWPTDVAIESVLDELPQGAVLWVGANARDADWGLAAEIALHQVPGLRKFQITGLRSFIDAEREASFARLNNGYYQPVLAGPVVCR